MFSVQSPDFSLDTGLYHSPEVHSSRLRGRVEELEQKLTSQLEKLGNQLTNWKINLKVGKSSSKLENHLEILENLYMLGP